MVKAKIIQFRRGRHKIHERHYLIDVSAKNRKEAEKFIGKEVEWKSASGKIIKGKISASHGNKGLVRAIFERGLPGQAINDDVEVSEGKLMPREFGEQKNSRAKKPEVS